MSQKFYLKLYVSGDTLRSQRAIANLEAFCQRKMPEETEIEIIDILKSPEIAESEKILITPTLVRESPLPKERVIGDLSNTEILALALDLYL
ncbi:MAG: circadian clock KaiB family protein [Pleurocapsa sp. MO_226.B13]|nr:circadian clock KaiB family protein [Pleurocapsa sp. MO_226.B13]